MPVRMWDWPAPSRLRVSAIRVSRVMRSIFARRDFIIVLDFAFAKKQSANLCAAELWRRSAETPLRCRMAGPAASCEEAGQKTRGVEARRATRTGRCDRLPINMIGTITGHENAGNICGRAARGFDVARSEEHTSELQSLRH